MSWRDLLAPARAPAPRWSPSAAQETQAQAAGEGAAPVWSTYGRADLSGVRVHADAEAAGLAEDYGAKAFTYGRDVFLGAAAAGGGPDASGVLAHELAHTVQQSDQPGPALQFAPKGDKAGPGASPPDDDFIRDENNWGAEDQHILFGQDQASLTTDEEIQAFAAQQKEAVNVHVHGYASEEGAVDYNLNLSAQRGVAIRRRLLELLPQGSKVVVFAHGKSQHFGAADKNRRVGLSLIGPADQGFQLRVDFGRPPAAWRQRAGVSDPPKIAPGGLFPTTLPSGSGLGLTPPQPVIPRNLMDLAAIGAPSALHGHSSGEVGNVVDMFDAAYLKYHRLGIPDRLVLRPFNLFDIDIGAASLANKEVSNSIQAYWERNDPTIIDKANQETGTKVLTSPNLLDLLPDKKKKK